MNHHVRPRTMTMQTSLVLAAIFGCAATATAAEAPKAPAPAPSRQTLLAGEVFSVAGRPVFIMLPPVEKRRKPQPWILYAPTLAQYPDQHERWMHEQFVAA